MGKKISKKIRKIVAAACLVSAISILVVFYLLLPDTISLNLLMFIAILIATVPSAILDFLNQRWMNAIDDQLPSLVRAISESQETGLTVARAMEQVVERKSVTGPLSEEVNKITVQMSWGLSFEKALENFVKRIGTPVVERFCALVLEASYSGGQIRKVFGAMSGFMEDMRAMEKDLSSQMRPYLIIIYAAFFVFLFTSIVLINSFFTPLEDYPPIYGGTGAGVTEFRSFFYQTMLISAVLGGLMAGKIGERRVLGGLKHAIVMAVAGFTAFTIAVA